MSVVPHQIRLVRQTCHVPEWIDTIREHWSELDIEHRSARAFQAELNLLRVDRAIIAKLVSTACKVRHLADPSASAHLINIVWQLQGTGDYELQGLRIRIAPGQMLIRLASQAFELNGSDDYCALKLCVDLSARPEWGSLAASLSGSVLPVDGMTRAAMAAAISLLDSTPGLELRAAISPICELVFESLRQNARQRGGAFDTHERVHSARQIVHAHLFDPDFGPTQLASKLGVSLRGLYLVFKQCGLSPAGFILSLRLEHCQAALADRLASQRTVTEIAFEYGFSNYSYFSRVFRLRYGASPREFRRQAVGAGE